ncbi:MAG TPA: exo-beta-N-acetylmuramidase NamZ domain-containing protein, partial [Verrucomicrobiae bacterium]
MSRPLFGVDQVLVTPGLLRGRIGLVTNDAARTALDVRVRSRVALQGAGFKLIRLFSPEHGLGADTDDGAPVRDGFDPLTGLPVVSLYGNKLRPPRASLADLDAVVFDIPDIGARFYTYIWTLSHVLEACAEAGVPLVVLDRPNPLGGDLAAAEGPILDVARYGSFVGRAAIPIRHSLTAGEL